MHYRKTQCLGLTARKRNLLLCESRIQALRRLSQEKSCNRHCRSPLWRICTRRLASNNISRIERWRFTLLSNSILNRLNTIDGRNPIPSITTDLATSFVDALCCHQGVEFDAEKPMPNRDLVRDFVKYSLEQGAKEPITINQLTDTLFTSKSVLSSAIKKSTGLTPLTFLRNVRLEQVRNELINGDPKTSVIEVAHRYGFPSRGHFSRYYREQFGELPRETLAKA